MNVLDQNVFLTRADAARVLAETGLPIRESTLRRLGDKGPRFRKINGRAVYTREWLDAWVRKQLEVQA